MSSVPPSEPDRESQNHVTNRRRGSLGGLLEPAILTWKLFWDGRVSLLLKLIPLAAIGYLVFPFDILPDVIPLLGLVDDVGILILALNLFVAFSPQAVVAEYRQKLGFSGGQSDEPDVVDGHAEVIDDR